uniref:Uncharacterized protein n=1 Tax=Plectus sambesii TaxID=2011161 RepID=A0A914VYS8_9BILA
MRSETAVQLQPSCTTRPRSIVEPDAVSCVVAECDVPTWPKMPRVVSTRLLIRIRLLLLLERRLRLPISERYGAALLGYTTTATTTTITMMMSAAAATAPTDAS